MKKFISVLLSIFLMVGVGTIFTACSSKNDVTIYSSMEDFRNEKLKEMLAEKFPDLKVEVQYVPSGNNAAKIKAEGTKIEADIILDIDYGYCENLKNNFADLSSIVNTNLFLDVLVPQSKKYLPLSRFSVGLIINEEIMKDKPLPTTYSDLKHSQYKQLIEMPSPIASGTGYGFLKGMVSYMGEDAAFAFFDDLAEKGNNSNIKKFSSSGSGPVNSLTRGDVGIGIGMIFQAVQEINKGVNLRILTEIEGGLAYNMSGCSVISGRETNVNVQKVFEFIAVEFSMYDKVHFLPEQIFKIQDETVIENYPSITNMDMKGFDPVEKERLLGKWKY